MWSGHNLLSHHSCLQLAKQNRSEVLDWLACRKLKSKSERDLWFKCLNALQQRIPSEVDASDEKLLRDGVSVDDYSFSDELEWVVYCTVLVQQCLILICCYSVLAWWWDTELRISFKCRDVHNIILPHVSELVIEVIGEEAGVLIHSHWDSDPYHCMEIIIYLQEWHTIGTLQTSKTSTTYSSSMQSFWQPHLEEEERRM